MSEHELNRLLGAFAADTLTSEEKQHLYTAALQDQQLFNALADEQALKDLLADPEVRRRLLEALRRPPAAEQTSLSWLHWFIRPQALTWAGGLTVAVLATVLGTKVYQDSLREPAQSVVTEDTKPASPAQPTSPPASMSEKNAGLKDSSITAPEGQRSSTPGAKEKQPAKRDEPHQRSGSEKTPAGAEDPTSALGKTSDTLMSSAERHSPAPRMEPPAVPERRMKTQGSPAAVAPAAGARARFYGEPVVSPDSGLAGAEQERPMTRPSVEATPETNRPDTRMERFAFGSKASDRAMLVQPLALRYSFVVRQTDGQDREVDTTTVVRDPGTMYLTVESNQEAYLQVWGRTGDSTPQLLFPEKDTGQISLRITPGQRQHIRVPTEHGRLTIRLSRKPFGPVTRQEAEMLDRPTADQWVEPITPEGSPARPEYATYVANRDTSATELSADVSVPSKK